LNAINEHDWMSLASADIDPVAIDAARERQACLTKPPGALGELETLAIRLAGMQRKPNPTLDRVHVCVFAADHGIACEGVSAFPQEVTAEMVKNFARGGAAISVAVKQIDASFEIINLGTVSTTDDIEGVNNFNIARGTKSFLKGEAMSKVELQQALSVGRHVAERCQERGVELFIGGEMGIANTTSASAMACAFLGVAPALLAGPGTGLNREGVNHKAKIIQQALDTHKSELTTPLAILQRLGGFEIAALCAAYIRCSQLAIPVFVDGFISTIAALCANKINSGVAQWLLFSHHSAEPGHQALLECLNAKPLLNLSMRLGEASGAAVALPILRMACALHNDMATFEQAQVSEKL